MGLKIFIFKFYLNNSEIFEFAFLFRTFSYDTMLDVVTGVLAMTSTLLLFVIATTNFAVEIIRSSFSEYDVGSVTYRVKYKNGKKIVRIVFHYINQFSYVQGIQFFAVRNQTKQPIFYTFELCLILNDRCLSLLLRY